MGIKEARGSIRRYSKKYGNSRVGMRGNSGVGLKRRGVEWAVIYRIRTRKWDWDQEGL